jgi:hypothetical protein
MLSNWPLELHLLIHLTRNQGDPELATALLTLSEVDWGKFAELAEHHRVECSVALNLAIHKSTKIPAGVRAHFAARLREQSLHSLVVNRATIELTNSLSEADIPSLLLKGLAVSARYYGATNARQSIDVDLLIAEEKVIRARLVLEKLGFEQYDPDFVVPSDCEDTLRVLAYHISYRRASDGAQLDLHWRLALFRKFLDWDFEKSNRSATQMSFAGNDLAVLETASQFNYLICHGAKHGWLRLKWLVDIHRMLNVMTDEQSAEAVRLSQRDGTMLMLATSLKLVRLIYNLPTTKFDEDQLRPHEDNDLLARMIGYISTPVDENRTGLNDTLQKKLADMYGWYRFHSKLRPDLAYKMTVAESYLANRRDIQTLRLSRKWLWLYVVAGPVLEMVRVGNRRIRSR